MIIRSNDDNGGWIVVFGFTARGNRVEKFFQRWEDAERADRLLHAHPSMKIGRLRWHAYRFGLWLLKPIVRIRAWRDRWSKQRTIYHTRIRLNRVFRNVDRESDQLGDR